MTTPPDRAADAERLVEDADERRTFDASNKALALSPPRAVAACLAVWHRMAPGGSQREMMAIFSNECAAADATITRLQQERDETSVQLERMRGRFHASVEMGMEEQKRAEAAEQERDTATREAEAKINALITGHNTLTDSAEMFRQEAEALREEVGRLRAERLTDGWDGEPSR